MTMAQKGPGPMPAISIILNPARGPRPFVLVCVLIGEGAGSGRRGRPRRELVTDSMIVGQKTGGRS